MVAQRAIGTLHYVEEAVYKAHKALIAAKFNGILLKEQKFDIAKDMHKPAFAAINPTKKVPFLETDMGCIFASNAIARYIARCRADTALYGECFDDESEIETWLEFSIHELEVPLATMVYPVLGLLDAPSAEVVSAAEKDVKAALAVMEERLKDSPFLAGNYVSLADIALVCSLREAMVRVLDPAFRKPYPKVCAWFEKCCAMDKFKSVLGETKLCTKAEKPVALKYAPPARKETKAKEAAKPKDTVKKNANAGVAPKASPAPAAAPEAADGEVVQKIREIGGQIAAMKAKLLAEGLQASDINKHPEILKLVTPLQELKKQLTGAGAPTGNAPTPAPPAPAAAAPAGDIDAKIKAKGDEIRDLKAKLKGEGLSGKKVDAHEDVKKLVAELQELKAACAAGGAAPAAAAATAPAPAPAPAAATAGGGDLDAQIKAKGDEVRELKAKLKSEGLSGKKVDAHEDVKKLVAELQELKASCAAGGAAPAPAAATAPAPAPAPAAAPSGGGDLDAQIKAKGDEVRELKAKLKSEGLSGKKVDAHEDVKKLVAELQELKAKQ